MPLIDELIDIPKRVQNGDFVLKLTKGVNDPGKTLPEYLFAPVMAKCHDSALVLIRSAVRGGTTKATYLRVSVRFGDDSESFVNEGACQLEEAMPEIKAREPSERDRASGRRRDST